MKATQWNPQVTNSPYILGGLPEIYLNAFKFKFLIFDAFSTHLCRFILPNIKEKPFRERERELTSKTQGEGRIGEI